MMDRRPTTAPALAILASMIVQNVGAAFAKWLFGTVGFQGVTALRVGLSAILLLAFWRPWRLPVPREARLSLLLYGATLGLMNLLIYSAFHLIPIGIAVAIEVTGPLLVVLFAARRRRDYAWVLLAALGLGLLLPIGAARDGSPLAPEGIVFAAGAALCWAGYIIFGKRVASLRGGQATAWGMLAASTITVPIGFWHAGSALLAPATLGAGLVVAVMCSLLPYSLEMMAMGRLPTRVFGMLVSATPAVAALAGFALLGERLTPQQWLAVGCIMVASAGSARGAGVEAGES